ncbi:hypothetical protein [Streptomyces sp. A1547]|uniref:hypothetical protein n=1 Tax=Streptomyces sp. A1547 TaxID=2563105 RepID=UPI00109E61CF|nr:hypothetical protein [Streptomyces sp. A1547]THA28471.1 hypothetical protein E6W17_40995 [Streptomyces sp. A1547]
MNAAKKSAAPNMGGVTDDWARTQAAKKRAEEEARRRAAGGGQAENDDQEEKPLRAPRAVGRSRGGRRPPPAAADAVPTTVRFDPEEAAELDFFVLELRDDAARRNLDKAEVIREALRLVREDPATKNKLIKRLR